jgi:hypothetical protein
MFMKGVDRTRTLNSYPTQASCGPLWATFGWFPETHPLENCEKWPWHEEVSLQAMPCLRSSKEKEWNQLHLQVLHSATPQRGKFRRDITASSITRSLGKCFLKILVHKSN